jgi:hypothetical protein
VANFGFLPNAIILSRTCPWDQRSSLPVHDIVPRIGDTARSSSQIAPTCGREIKRHLWVAV